MRWVQVNKARTFDVDLPSLADSAGSFEVRSPEGGVVQTGAPALEAVSTTLTATAAAGARTLTVASTTGFVVGRDYLLGGPEATGGETITILRVVSATSLTLVAGLRTQRASGDALVSTRVRFAVAALATCDRNYRIEYSWVSGTVEQDLLTVPFDVVRYCPASYLSVAKLRALDALASKRIPDGTWLPSTFALTWDMLLRRVAAKLPPGGVAGTLDLTVPHGYLTLLILIEPGAGEASTDALLARLETRFSQELEACLATLPTDHNQDGDTKTMEPGFSPRTILFRRG